jgi:hypothetical protein
MDRAEVPAVKQTPGRISAKKANTGPKIMSIAYRANGRPGIVRPILSPLAPGGVLRTPAGICLLSRDVHRGRWMSLILLSLDATPGLLSQLTVPSKVTDSSSAFSDPRRVKTLYSIASRKRSDTR